MTFFFPSLFLPPKKVREELDLSLIPQVHLLTLSMYTLLVVTFQVERGSFPLKDFGREVNFLRKLGQLSHTVLPGSLEVRFSSVSSTNLVHIFSTGSPSPKWNITDPA